MAFWDPLERLRQPEYTGSNRCTPCTVLNVAIAALLALVVAVLTLYAVGRAAAAVAGGTTMALSTATIYLRGYLVPGTPRLTETYVPDRYLRRVGKRTEGVDDGADVSLALKGIGARSSVESDQISADRACSVASGDDESAADEASENNQNSDENGGENSR